MLVTLLLSMQDQMEQLNQHFEKLVEQLAAVNNQVMVVRLSVIDGQLSLDMIFNEAEALTDTLYVVEPTEEQVLPTKSRKQSAHNCGPIEYLINLFTENVDLLTNPFFEGFLYAFSPGTK